MARNDRSLDPHCSMEMLSDDTFDRQLLDAMVFALEFAAVIFVRSIFEGLTF